jgi:hypothetical protein
MRQEGREAAVRTSVMVAGEGLKKLFFAVMLMVGMAVVRTSVQGWSRRLRGRATVGGRGTIVEASSDLVRVHHALRQLVLPVGDLVVLALVLSLVRVELTAGVEHVVAVVSDAMDVVDGLGKAAVAESALVVLHELLEAVLVQLLVLHVEVLVLLHVGLVLEGEVAAAAVAVKVGRLLISERAVRCAAIFLTSKPKHK